MKLKVLEIFSGTQSISKSFREKGHETLCVEYDSKFLKEPYNLNQWTTDVLDVTTEEVIERLGGKPDIIWGSPVCVTHSIAAISKHRTKLDNGFLIAKSEKAKLHDKYLTKLLELIDELNPTYYFIENPRGGMRKSALMQDITKKGRYTVSYCQYGDKRMKPTDVWTNHPNPRFKPICKNGDPCHEAAPRGSKTGTQGLKGNTERSVIPKALCDHIVHISEDIFKPKNFEEMTFEELLFHKQQLESLRFENEWQSEFNKLEIIELNNFIKSKYNN